MEIILGKQQEQAVESIINFLKNSKETSYGLFGYAGTGKSTIIKWLVDYLYSEVIEHLLCAPTHKARAMIKYTAGLEAITVHQVLHLIPNIEIKDLDLRDLLFLSRNKAANEIPRRGVLICDEASMINDVLYNFLVEEARAKYCKIIFVGDKAQLKPVKSSEESLVFTIKDQFILTEIFRQSKDSGLSSVLPILRNDIIYNFRNSIGNEGSLICTSSAIELFKNAYPSFKQSIEENNIFGAKFFAYTNARTDALNLKIRSLLFPGNEQFYEQEIVTFNDNYSYGFMDYWNSMDYIIQGVTQTSSIIPNFGYVEGYKLVLYDSFEDIPGEVFVIDPNISHEILTKLAYLIESTRLDAIRYKYIDRKKAANLWKTYYQIIGSFATFDNIYFDNRIVKKKTLGYGYASTVHKSQGSSIDNVFIDMKNILSCRDSLEIRQLQYVSVSRARKNVYMLQ